MCSLSRISTNVVTFSSYLSFSAYLSKNVTPRIFRTLFEQKRLITSSTMGKKIALVLSGCGVYDGTELHEASACLVHLSRRQADIVMFAPNVEQTHTIDHSTQLPSLEKRNVLVESARIARGAVMDLADLDVRKFDAVVFPGGFGAAKNLSTFAFEGENCSVNINVKKVIEDFIKAKKPIGLCCISPVIAAKVVEGCEVTIGKDADTAAKIQRMGAEHISTDVMTAHIDQRYKIITTAAFMGSEKFYEVHDGIGHMITSVLELT